jgi:hypothetical protein
MIDLDNEWVQIVAVSGIVALGCVSLLIDSANSTTIAIAVSTALGVLVGYLFPRGGEKNEEVQEHS